MSLLHIEAGAVVPHLKHLPALPGYRGDLDGRPRCPSRVLPSVADQVLKGDAQQASVAVAGDVRLYRDLDEAIRGALPKVGDDVADDRRDVDELTFQLDLADLREGEQVVDEAFHLRGGPSDAFSRLDQLLRRRLQPRQTRAYE